MDVLHQGSDTLIISINSVTNITNLKTVSNMQIHAHCTAIISNKLIGECNTAAYILEVEIIKMVNIQNPQLIILPTVHLKD